MDEIAQWLREQIAETLRIAAEACDNNFMRAAWEAVRLDHPRLDPQVVQRGKPFIIASDVTDEAARHIALNDPDPMIAQCDAHTSILDAHPLVGDTGDDLHNPRCGVCVAPGGIGCGEYPEDWKTQPWPCPTVRALAVAYRDRPGYRTEWKL